MFIVIVCNFVDIVMHLPTETNRTIVHYAYYMYTFESNCALYMYDIYLVNVMNHADITKIVQNEQLLFYGR
jgi:hypothetical protein